MNYLSYCNYKYTFFWILSRTSTFFLVKKVGEERYEFYKYKTFIQRRDDRVKRKKVLPEKIEKWISHISYPIHNVSINATDNQNSAAFLIAYGLWTYNSSHFACENYILNSKTFKPFKDEPVEYTPKQDVFEDIHCLLGTWVWDTTDLELYLQNEFYFVQKIWLKFEQYRNFLKYFGSFVVVDYLNVSLQLMEWMYEEGHPAFTFKDETSNLEFFKVRKDVSLPKFQFWLERTNWTWNSCALSTGRSIEQFRFVQGVMKKRTCVRNIMWKGYLRPEGSKCINLLHMVPFDKYEDLLFYVTC